MTDQPSILLGLIGYGIQASLTPAMHEREAAEQGLRCIYQRIDLQQLGLGVEVLPDLLTAAERMGFAGLNITFPCKQAVIPLLHELSDNARALGAVNTVVLRDGKRTGHNTDLFGFGENFRRGLPDVRREHVVQMGAGGAGSAVAHALLSRNVGHLTIFDVDAARAEHLAADLLARLARAARLQAPICLSPCKVRTAWSTPRQWEWPNSPVFRYRRSRCGPNSGLPTSSTSRSRPNFLRAPAHSAAGQ